MATPKANTRATRKTEAGSNAAAETTDDKSTTEQTVVTGDAGTAGSGDVGTGEGSTGAGTEGAGEEGSASDDASKGTDDASAAGAKGSDSTSSVNTSAGDLSDGDFSALEVLMTNNSVSGHEILRADGSILAINGHCKDLSITTTKEELVAIQAALADKPWVVIKLKEAE